VKEVRLPVPADLSLSSFDYAVGKMQPVVRPTLIVGLDLADVADKLRGERDFTLRVVTTDQIGHASWWILTDGESRCLVDPAP
jgi:hypothetical protein